MFFAFLALWALPHSLGAQNTCGRSFEFQFLPMNVWGDDILREYVSGEQGLILEDGIMTFVTVYNERRVPVAIAAGRGISLKTDFSRSVGKHCEWFLGARGWLFSGVASLEDTIRLREGESGSAGVRLWGEPHFQLVDTRKADQLSYLNVYSGNRHFVWAADLYATRRLGQDRRTSASVTLGFRLGKMSNTRVDIVQNEAYISDYVPASDSGPSLDVYYYKYRGANSEANSNLLVGPLLGFNGVIREGKFQIRGSFTQSFLFGNVRHGGQWIDFSDLWFARQAENGELRRLAPLGREIIADPLSAYERAFIKVTELALDVSFNPRRRIFMGAGVFVSHWSDVPLAAGWLAPLFDWQLRRANPVYAGISTIAGFRF